ncbi:verrucotoxin subunit beta-like [Silurus meridionalis]|nr:verrucotoxin subunit beta-like [Silurus meridionalis]
MAALGRALYPGMLYDCRTDSFIPGVTLWDRNSMYDNLDVHDQTKTFVKLVASDSISEKANLLDVKASLKASFLCGLVEVGGSAKYLHDTKSSARQSRVTMQYSQTTKFEQLTMKELGNITYPQVFEQKSATHVITAVQYGASAFLVFDYISAENENKQEIEGNLYATIKKIPTISIEGQASLTMNQNEKNLTENMNVTFYGDYELEENPTTYTEALRACRRLPTLLKERKSKGVPVTVWLYPLTLLNDRAAKLVREISLNLVTKTENVLEDLGEVQRRSNDFITNPIVDVFHDIKNRLLQFQELVGYYKSSFLKELAKVLPTIRNGEVEEKDLQNILNNHYLTAFTNTHMNKWLDDISAELNILSSYTSGLKDVKVVRSLGSLNSFLFDPDVDVVVCLSFTSLKNEDPYIVTIKDFVKSNMFANLGQQNVNAFPFQATQPWFTSRDISASMRQNLSLFTSFFKANINNKRIKFIIAAFSDPSNPGTSIQLYQNSSLKTPKFQPVSKPSLPVVETSEGKVLLKFSKSPTGETIRFRVEYRTTPPTDAAAWTVINTSDAQTSFTLTGLKSGEQYWVQYRAVSDVGVSEASDAVSFSLLGKDHVTVDKWDLSMPSLFNKIRHKIMSSMGMSRWSLSTIKSEVTNVVSSPSIPYTDTNRGGLKSGMALYFQGVVPAAGNVFEINLIAGQREVGGVAFHLKFCINDATIYNSYRNGKWEGEEKTSCPISKGSAFDVFLVIKTEGYEIYVNGQRRYLFKHRMPIEKVTTLYIGGDVIMNVIGTVPNWNNSTFVKELNSGTSRVKHSNIQSDVPQAVCNPTKGYFSKLSVTMKPGMALFFQGVVPSDCCIFEITFVTSLRYGYDNALHFSAREDHIVLNSSRDGAWGNEELINWCPFVKGAAFDIFVLVKPEGYEIILNGLGCYTFKHRVAIEKVNSMYIAGDVFINNFGISEVENVSVSTTVPVKI